MKKSQNVKQMDESSALQERFADAIREAQEENITLIEYVPATGEAWRITPDGKVEPYDVGPDQTDWARVEALTDEEILANALSDPDAQPWNEEDFARARAMRRPPTKL